MGISAGDFFFQGIMFYTDGARGEFQRKGE